MRSKPKGEQLVDSFAGAFCWSSLATAAVAGLWLPARYSAKSPSVQVWTHTQGRKSALVDFFGRGEGGKRVRECID